MNSPSQQNLSFKCGACNRTLSVPASAAGKIVACPCGQKLRVLTGVSPGPSSVFDADLPQSSMPYRQPINPYQSPLSAPGTKANANQSSDVSVVISGQKVLVFSILGYFCSLPILLLANVFLGGTAEKPIVTVEFGLVLALGIMGLFAAACCACFGIFRMGRILFPGSTRYVYAVGVLVPAPLIGLLVMFVANSKATGYLKAKGIRVGLLGATV